MNLQKKAEEKFCNCRNSKCMKLYCQCFAARVQCGKNCHCIDCHNKNNAQHLKLYKDYNNSSSKNFKDQFAKQHKGCACRKSGCTKKYCECYQAGLLCRDICKCIECQNNESLSNKKVISQLKRNSSSNSNRGASLYPIILTQDNRHMNQILADQNPLNIRDQWIEQTAQDLYKKGQQGSIPKVIEKLLEILNVIQMEEDQEQKDYEMQIRQRSQSMQGDSEERSDEMREEESQSMMEQENAQSPISYQDLKEK